MPTPVCRACGTAITLDEPIPRDSECASCGHDVRCCANCRHYDTRYNNSCRETEADPVEDKHHRNFCEYFSLSREPFVAEATSARAAEAREKLGRIFGGAGPPAPTQSAREKIDSLFGGTKPADDRAADARKKLDALFGKPKPDPDEPKRGNE